MHQYLVQKPAGSRSRTELSSLKGRARADLWLRTELQKDTYCNVSFGFISAVPAVRIPAQNASLHEHMGRASQHVLPSLSDS